MITSGGIGVRWEGRNSHQYSATIHIKSSSADTLWDASANNRLHEKIILFLAVILSRVELPTLECL
jgi:hypothetical protein